MLRGEPCIPISAFQLTIFRSVNDRAPNQDAKTNLESTDEGMERFFGLRCHNNRA